MAAELRPDPLGELKRSPDSLAAIWGLLLREGEGRGKGGGKGKRGVRGGREGREKGRNGREGGERKGGERREMEGREVERGGKGGCPSNFYWCPHFLIPGVAPTVPDSTDSSLPADFKPS